MCAFGCKSEYYYWNTLHGGNGGMALLRLEPPPAFDFKNPDQWPHWNLRFEEFRSATALDAESETRQVSVLLYCMAGDVLTSTKISEEDRKKYNSVMKKFDEFIDVRRNVILERAKFNGRNQIAGEQYITSLYSLVETCKYPADMVDEMLRERLVVGMRDNALAERLQLDSELTLEKAKKAMRQKEAVKEQNQMLQDRNGSKTCSMDAVRTEREKGRWRDRGQDNSWRSRSNNVPVKTVKHKCTHCGKAPHLTGDRCPASTATCHKCNKKGHFQSQCFSKNTAHTNELSVDSAFLGAINSEKDSLWQISALVDDKSTSFKLDNGAQVTAMSERTYRDLQLGPLKKPSKFLYGPGESLDVMGQVTVKITVGSRSSKQTVFVVRGLRRDLMGLPAITSLNLARQIGQTIAKTDFKQRFPKVFSGLGNLGDEYCIKLRDGAVPYSLFTPRNVDIPLRDKVHKELEQMEAMGMISKVSQPTEWCAGMVVVPKRSGEVRICIDLKPLNESELYLTHHSLMNIHPIIRIVL